MYIEELDPFAGGQVMNLILSLKKSYLQFAATERWIGWRKSFFMRSFLLILEMSLNMQRLFVNLDVTELNDLLASLVEEFSQQN